MTHLWAECQDSKLGCVEKIHGDGEVNISASIRSPCTKFFGKFHRHIGTCLEYLGGVDTSMGRALVPKTRPSCANTLGRMRSIFQFLLGPHAPNTFWRFLKDIETFLDHLQGVDTPVGRVPALKTGLI